MTQILSWNIQNGKGVDNVVSLSRIKDVVGNMGTPDILCFQEVSRGLTLDAKVGAPDQIAELEQLFPGYTVVFGSAVNAASPGNGTWEFGNAILTRLPLLNTQMHTLPRPAVAETRHMTRQAMELVVQTPTMPLRIVNLHLEFHSQIQRLAQVNRLREIQFESIEENQSPPKADADGPYQAIPRPVDAIYCGDFNMLYNSQEYLCMLSPLEQTLQPFTDAWTVAHPSQSHDPTCGIYDHQSWPEGAHCRDFFFAAGRCAQRITDVTVNTTTDASDHQPLIMTLDDAD